VIPIMDLRRRFGIEQAPNTRHTKFIIVRLDRRLVGLVVDRVIGVHRMPASAIRPTPRWIAGPEASVFSGVCLREKRLVLLVDMAELVTTDEKLHLGDLRLPTEADWGDLGVGAEPMQGDAPFGGLDESEPGHG
jgi:purine-binding chemotaxis protein CheW